MSPIREKIMRINELFQDWVARRTLNPKNDPQKQFEVNLWLEIHGQTHDGESNYKKRYYDKLTSEDEKLRVQITLSAMLKSQGYSLSNKAIIAYVCADIGISESLQDIRYLLQHAEGQSFEKQVLTLAYEALSRGISVHELTETSETSHGI